MGGLSINPFTWTAEIRHLRFSEREAGETFASLRSARLAGSPSSLWRGEPVLAGARIASPYPNSTTKPWGGAWEAWSAAPCRLDRTATAQPKPVKLNAPVPSDTPPPNIADCGVGAASPPSTERRLERRGCVGMPNCGRKG
jgi:hypothetical protein